MTFIICMQVVFSKKQKLKYHMRIHTGEGLETCHICGKVHSKKLNRCEKDKEKVNSPRCSRIHTRSMFI